MNENQAHKYSRLVDLDVDIGADAVDYNAIAKQESLSGLEVEMRKLEGVVKEIVEELNYLKRREARMRDTNGELSISELSQLERAKLTRCRMSVLTESTNERVATFFYLTFSALVVLGAWQIIHLRSYFKKSELP